MTREEKLKAIEKIESLPREKRWREACNLYLKMNPKAVIDGQIVTAKDEYQAVVQHCRRTRDGLARKSGSTKSGTMYVSFSYPNSLLAFIKVFDPDLFEGSDDQKDRDTKKFKQVFREFVIA